MNELITIAKAIGDESRVRTLMFLRHGELCLCQIIEMLALAPSTVSKHMSVLHQAGLVEIRKQGRWIYYHLAKNSRSPTVRGALHWLQHSLTTDKRTIEDSARLRSVLRRPLKELCQCYGKS